MDLINLLHTNKFTGFAEFHRVHQRGKNQLKYRSKSTLTCPREDLNFWCLEACTNLSRTYYNKMISPLINKDTYLSLVLVGYFYFETQESHEVNVCAIEL